MTTGDNETPAATPSTIVLVRDLMFSSRILNAAKDANVPVRSVRDPSKLAEIDGQRLIVDLNADGFLDAAADWKRRTNGEVMGFVSHVDTESIARAKSAGIDRILSRGQFTQSLPGLLKRN